MKDAFEPNVCGVDEKILRNIKKKTQNGRREIVRNQTQDPWRSNITEVETFVRNCDAFKPNVCGMDDKIRRNTKEKLTICYVGFHF